MLTTTMRKPILTLLLLTLLTLPTLRLAAQQYTGLSGLLHVPSADMDDEGIARLGAHALNKHFTPAGFKHGGKKYNTSDYYISVTAFPWLELSYAFTLLKMEERYYDGTTGKVGYKSKDRNLSFKLRLLKEKDWWPSVAIGGNDIHGTAYLTNYWVAASKHYDLGGHLLGAHAAWRDWHKSRASKGNAKWNGLAGGITYSPPVDHHRLRGIVEYTGHEINIGADYLLLGHVLLQATLQQGRYFSGGLCFQMALLK